MCNEADFTQFVFGFFGFLFCAKTVTNDKRKKRKAKTALRKCLQSNIVPSISIIFPNNFLLNARQSGIFVLLSCFHLSN